MSEQRISADEARKLAKNYDLNLGQLLKRCFNSIKSAASRGNLKKHFYFKKQAVSEDELKELEKQLIAEGYKVKITLDKTPEHHFLEVFWME